MGELFIFENSMILNIYLKKIKDIKTKLSNFILNFRTQQSVIFNVLF